MQITWFQKWPLGAGGEIFLLSSQIVFDSMREKAFAFQTFVKKRTLKSPAKVPERL